MAETLSYLPEGTIIPSRQVEAALPERRLSNSEQLIANLAPGQLPTELDLAISSIISRRMSKD
ncbi:hypothetical protein A2574_00735 [Candidatus Shapirobacteria bacterium RIFOXYD1_FULL_38_32]|uniref:Uncharacterized protein n=1 Tax=Candidatus Shapirobacteria bacterium GW2011_GWE1_38_92 TaxID=1618489 RepID=A0A0G0LPG6_9BACT|nr:MAG: hypothetical protein UT14_C0050G0006 [Candidatus Shapirobacteria bacterium GW2011_GWE1_38_92]OGL56369.1 MAG: hypothetical protein A2195_03215 [Candidatus Shapirobacteria bacterium RIFOXYA1_FULL_39_17]OGL56597.1 MAG: hypothetical protein A2410_01000 [Candidatus Shapirobacteria bacterium RIFOXYC1_FULL_38_24]OGL57988.1 MAG: hypothetical protein A2574_00735 [Candidatus Shapirobacteria bacterium RIFOXYD1_FULL_38_32]HAP37921.1 hypothetical protein [Candidatus Shapirobacteria bacterium]